MARAASRNRSGNRLGVGHPGCEFDPQPNAVGVNLTGERYLLAEPRGVVGPPGFFDASAPRRHDAEAPQPAVVGVHVQVGRCRLRSAPFFSQHLRDGYDGRCREEPAASEDSMWARTRLHGKSLEVRGW